MSFPVELFSHRCRGELAACWLAATSSEKEFRKHYRSTTINKMSVTSTCDEIVDKLRSSGGKHNLYLVSQLMYGITKIHSYQVANYEKDVLKIQQTSDLTSLKEIDKEFDVEKVLDTHSLDLPSLTEDLFRAVNLKEDLNILRGERLDDKLDIIMEDAVCLDFGALTDEEVDIMCRDRWFDLDENVESNNKTWRVCDESVEIEEVHRERQSPIGNLDPALVDVSDRKSTTPKGSRSPQKKRSTPQPGAITPSKRTRFSLTDEIAPPGPSETATVPIPELPVEQISVPAPPPPSAEKISIELVEPLHPTVEARKKRPRKAIDENTMLTSNQLKNQIRNKKIACMESANIPRVRANLFDQPSHRPKQKWATKLYNKSFRDRISGPFTTPNEEVPRENINEMDITEEGVPEIEKIIIDNQTVPHAFEYPIVEDGSTIPTITMTNIVTTGISNIDITETHQKKLDTIDLNETFPDIEDMKKEQRDYSTEDILLNSSIPTSESVQITSQEILALLEVLWCNQPCVKFTDLISIESYTKTDAATVFEILLELFAKKKVILEQRDCFRTLWIRKYHP